MVYKSQSSSAYHSPMLVIERHAEPRCEKPKIDQSGVQSEMPISRSETQRLNIKLPFKDHIFKVEFNDNKR